MKKRKNILNYSWVFGFIGLRGFMYFVTKDPSDLFFLTYLAFFTDALDNQMFREVEDERMVKNRRKSNQLALLVAIAFLFIIALIPTFGYFDVSKTFFIGTASLGVGLTIITNNISFYYFEKKS